MWLVCANKSGADSEYNRVTGKIKSIDNAFQANIEMYFDHQPEDTAVYAGRSFCGPTKAMGNIRGTNVCKTMGEQGIITGDDIVYWF